ADKMRLLDPEVFAAYACNDARYTYRLWQQFELELEQQGLKQIYEIEKSLVPVVMKMERIGMLVDIPMLAILGDVVNDEIKRLRAEVCDHAGCHFDLNSPQKVAAILYDKLGVPNHKATNCGQRSVDRESLEEVRGYHPAVDALLRYREVDKLASTFI